MLFFIINSASAGHGKQKGTRQGTEAQLLDMKENVIQQLLWLLRFQQALPVLCNSKCISFSTIRTRKLIKKKEAGAKRKLKVLQSGIHPKLHSMVLKTFLIEFNIKNYTKGAMKEPT